MITNRNRSIIHNNSLYWCESISFYINQTIFKSKRSSLRLWTIVANLFLIERHLPHFLPHLCWIRRQYMCLPHFIHIIKNNFRSEQCGQNLSDRNISQHAIARSMNLSLIQSVITDIWSTFLKVVCRLLNRKQII